MTCVGVRIVDTNFFGSKISTATEALQPAWSTKVNIFNPDVKSATFNVL